MSLISLAAFAATHGASKQAATKWRGRGAIVFQGEMVDLEKSDQRMKDMRLGRFRVERGEPDQPPSRPAPKASKARQRKAEPPSPPPDLAATLEDLAGAAADDFLANVLAGDFATIGEAERIKENALAAKHLIAARREAGSLVDVEAAEAIFFEYARSWRDFWMGFPTRIGPMLAADIDIDSEKLIEGLGRYVHDAIEQLGEPAADAVQVKINAQ